MIELPLIVDMEVESDAEYEVEVDTTFSQGGATNFVEGSFTVGTDTTQTIEIPYEGNGYPIACEIWIDGGMYSPKDSSFSRAPSWAIGSWMMMKALMDTEPNYTDDSYRNNGFKVCGYKSNSSPLAYSYSGAVNSRTYTSRYDPSSGSAFNAYFASNKALKLYTGGGTYSFAQGFTYRYFVVYSE